MRGRFLGPKRGQQVEKEEEREGGGGWSLAVGEAQGGCLFNGPN